MDILASTKLEPFLLVAKGSKGAHTAKTIHQAISSPGVFVFSELLRLASAQELSKNEQHESSYRLLLVFAYGTWADYQAQASSLPPLTAQQATKLKHLTLVTLAKSNRTLSYVDLLASLSLTTVRELEDFLIEGMYHGLVKGKMDQQRRCFMVDECIGRDVDPAELAILRKALEEWAQTQTDLIGSLSAQITHASAESADHQSSLLRYQIDRDAAVSEAANKSAAPPSSNTWGGSRSGGGNDDWDMGGGGGGGGGKSGGGGVKAGGKKPLGTHGSPAHARKKNKN